MPPNAKCLRLQAIMTMQSSKDVRQWNSIPISLWGTGFLGWRMSTKICTKLVAAEMANPKVQVYGDVAILSYNFAGVTKDKDGKIENPRAKSTRGYVKQGGQWRLVHANFGADPLPK